MGYQLPTSATGAFLAHPRRPLHAAGHGCVRNQIRGSLRFLTLSSVALRIRSDEITNKIANTLLPIIGCSASPLFVVRLVWKRRHWIRGFGINLVVDVLARETM